MKRSKFSLSHYKLLTCDMGELIPVALLDVLPGDTLQGATSMLIRMSPMLAPPMHPVHARIHWWYVPNRILWDGWEDFITGGPDGMNAAIHPHMQVSGVQLGSLHDYFGLPVGGANPIFSALPFRAYSLIWNEWYRDQDLQPELAINKGDGNDTITSQALMHVNWEKDYFTSARPWEQKGPQVSIPLTGNAPVKGIGAATQTYNPGTQPRHESGSTGTTVYPFEQVTTAANMFYVKGTAASTGKPDIFADLSTVSGVTINDLREALAIQRFEEARARYGSRFVEYLRYLGVRSSDARLQRPEYLGGGKQTLQFSEVLQTSPEQHPVGTMRGHGISALRSRRFRRFFEEHGIVMALMSVKPRTMYYQGLHRMWTRFQKEKYWQKELEHIGQQEVEKNEVFYLEGAAGSETFGYQDRYDEYRRWESSVAGEFRGSMLNHWHFGREFASGPALNDSFVKCVPTERVFASASTDVLYVMAMHSLQARRLVSKVGSSFTF